METGQQTARLLGLQRADQTGDGETECDSDLVGGL